MSFALVILEAHGQRAERGQAGGEAAYAAMLAFADDLRERGQLVLAQALATAQAVMTALYERDRTGRAIDVAGSLLGPGVLTTSETYLQADGTLSDNAGNAVLDTNGRPIQFSAHMDVVDARPDVR